MPAGSTSTRSSGPTAVPSSPRSPFTKTFMCRRMSLRSSRIQPATPGFSRSSSSKRSRIVEPSTGCSERSPASCLSGWRSRTTAIAPVYGGWPGRP